jgi:hypothetical protein
MSHEDLAACRRMRACLVGIADLDPKGVAARIADMDREIARLEALLGAGRLEADHKPAPIEIIPIGTAVRAA